MELINLYDYEAAARERLPQQAWDYYSSGAHDEITLRENHAAYDRITLRYRVLRDVSELDPSTTLLGHALSMPVLIAPTAFQRMAHPDGEVATCRAAGAAGTIMVLSTLSNTSMEQVTAAASGPVWFQLYVYRDRDVSTEIVRRAEAAGCTAIVVTVDAPVLGVRERDVRNRFQLPEGLSVENLLPAGKAALPHGAGESGLAQYAASMFDPSLSWTDLEWLSGLTSLPVLIKGIAHPDDARLAVEHGAAGIVVSNHGGRQLDTSPATIDVLPDIVTAVRGSEHTDTPVLLDGGIRRGTDIIKAIALGADAVCIGRPVLWGLAVDGTGGVTSVLDILRGELETAMALCGCPSVSEIREMGTDLVGGSSA